MSAERCVHGLDARFCSLCLGQHSAPARPRAALGNARLDEILRFLNANQIRATYGAVGEVVGVIPRALGVALGHRCPEASWVVNAANGVPTGHELLLRMAAWKRGGE